MKLTSAIRALALFPAVAFAIDGDHIAKTFEIMSYVSRDTADSAMEIFPPNATVDYYYPNIAYGFSVLTATTENVVALLTPSSCTSLPTLTADEQAQICSAAGLFVSIHLNLLDIMIGKRDILKSSQLTATGKSNNEAFLEELMAFDIAINSLYKAIVSLLPTCLGELDGYRESYDKSAQRMTKILKRIQGVSSAILR